MIAGTQHGGRPGIDPSPGPCVNPRNPHSATPALARALVALEEWVSEASRRREPRAAIADGTRGRGRHRQDAGGARFRASRRAPTASARRSIGSIRRPRLDNFYGTRVSAVDADGNEVAGIRLPPIAVPLGTYTGWNVYRAQPCELCDRDGSLIPFARTEPSARPPATRGPRSRSATAATPPMSPRSEAAADALVAERLLLPADAAAYVRTAESCDWL